MVRHLIGLVALIAIVVVAILEFRAWAGAVQAVRTLESAQDELKSNRFAPPLTKEQVQIILGRPPTGPDVQEGMFEKQVYVWKGVFRRYTLSAYFLGGEPKLLENFSVE
jgi:hypothetical protein